MKSQFSHTPLFDLTVRVWSTSKMIVVQVQLSEPWYSSPACSCCSCQAYVYPPRGIWHGERMCYSFGDIQFVVLCHFFISKLQPGVLETSQMTSGNHTLTAFGCALLERADEKWRKGKHSCVFKVLLLEVRTGFAGISVPAVVGVAGRWVKMLLPYHVKGTLSQTESL